MELKIRITLNVLMKYGRFAVDYEYRPYNPDRTRKERVEKADNIGN